jgi:hypothetical protein
MYLCSAACNSQSRSIQLECLIAKLEFTCTATTLSTTVMASSPRFRSFDLAKLLCRSSSSCSIRAPVFKNCHGRPRSGSARHMAAMLCLHPHARARWLASSTRGQSRSSFIPLPHPRHFPSLLSTTATPWSPCILS